jgi:hypothetical protein
MVAHASETAGIDSLSRRLTEAATGRCELWHDTNGNAYASFDREDANKVSHREHWSIGSRGFREWLAFLAHTELKATPSAEIIKSCASALAGIAKFDGPEYVPGRRVMKTANGYWLDICDDEWRAISITDMGWQVVSRPPVRFMRNGAMRSLPIPVPGGDIAKLYPLVNIPVEDLTLALALLLDWLRPDTPYPVLELIGEQGSAKSTTQKTLRALIDPNKVMLRGRPKTVEDLFVAAGNNHLISLENLSGLSADLSDALCTIATGGGQAGRQYFTNDEEFTIEAHNPVAVNGIGAIITRPDLLDRAVALCLPVINGRMTELEHTQALEAAASDILGGLLDLFVKTLAFLPKVVIAPEQRPRMADFAMLGEAMVQSMGQPEGSFLGLYQHHRRDAIRRTIDSNPVAVACISFLKKHGSFEGTVGNLLGRLNLLGNDIEKGDYWPRTPRGLGDGLRRVAPALRQVGIDVSVDNKAKRDGVHCRLKLLPGDSYLVDGGPAHVLEPSPTSQRSPVGRNTKATTTKHGRKV